MNKIVLGTIAGLILAILDALSMIPLVIPDKSLAIWATLINRTAIGFLIGSSVLPVPAWLKGLIIGLLLSLPDAIITRAYGPILGIGIIGGIIIGLIVGKWGKEKA